MANEGFSLKANAVQPDAPAPDSARLGPALLVAASLIAAMRTAGWSSEQRSPANPAWESELDQSILLAHRIFAHLDQKSPFLFRRIP